MSQLRWDTVTPLLKKVLLQLMAEPLFNDFRLVGGTALSLQLGHRESIDIDLFTDATYGSIDFIGLDKYLRHHYSYVSPATLPTNVGMGQSYIVGEHDKDAIKLDLFYTTDDFIESSSVVDQVRMATLNDIIAMKIDVVQRMGRKKDFWDLHEFIDAMDVRQMLELHKKRYPYNHDETLIEANLTNFSLADNDFDPVPLNGKDWGIIKLDFIEFVKK